MFFPGNWIDLLLLILLLVYLIEGFRTGFIAQTIELVGFALAFLGALSFFGLVAKLLEKFFQIPSTFGNPIGFFTVWFFIEFIYFAFIRGLIKRIPKSWISSKVDKIFSPIPSIVNCLVLFGFILTLLVSLPVPAKVKEAIFKSQTGSRIVTQTSRFEKPLKGIFGGAVEQGLNFLTIRTGSGETIDLKFTQKVLSIDPGSEQKMIELVNLEREQRGIKPLQFDPALREVGRAHSKYMFERGYFSHVSPEGDDVGDRLGSSGVGYFVAGENLAYAPNVTIAHEGLMDSPGHKRNILDPDFGKIGIGVLDGGIYGKMFTQVFTD